MRPLNTPIHRTLRWIACQFAIGLVAVSAASTLAAEVGVAEIKLFDKTRARPVHLSIWYPAGNDCKDVEICLDPSVDRDNVAVFSHGSMGAAKGYSWLGKSLAENGIVTIGMNHFGESWVYGTANIDPSAALRVWERPLDISFALNALEKNLAADQPLERLFSEKLNWSKVTAIGHSAGGASVLLLAGTAFAFDRASVHCQSSAGKHDKSCEYVKFLETPIESVPATVETTFTDERITRVVALDPALGHVMDAKSLKSLNLPTLIVGSKQNDFLVYKAHAGFYAAHIPGAKTLTLDEGEGHFVYLDVCQHEHQALGVSLCHDRKGIDRQQVHQKMLPEILKFIRQQNPLPEKA